MSLQHKAASSYIKLQYQEQMTQLKLTDELIVNYEGALNQLTISEIEHEIEQKLKNLHLTKSEEKKIFFTAVELIQNQFLYGIADERNTQISYFTISKNSSTIKINGVNLIQTSQINSISKRISIINSFTDKDELKSYYLNELANNKFGDKGGAGLGFITIALKSKNLLKTQFKQIDDTYSIFLLNINFDINTNKNIFCPRFEGFNI